MSLFTRNSSLCKVFTHALLLLPVCNLALFSKQTFSEKRQFRILVAFIGSIMILVFSDASFILCFFDDVAKLKERWQSEIKLNFSNLGIFLL